MNMNQSRNSHEGKLAQSLRCLTMLRCRAWGTLLLVALFLLSDTVEGSGIGATGDSAGSGNKGLLQIMEIAPVEFPLKGIFFRKGISQWNDRTYTIRENGHLTYTNGKAWIFEAIGSLDLEKTHSIVKVAEGLLITTGTDTPTKMARVANVCQTVQHEQEQLEKMGDTKLAFKSEVIRLSGNHAFFEHLKFLYCTLGTEQSLGHLKSLYTHLDDKESLEKLKEAMPDLFAEDTRRRMYQRQFSSSRDSPVMTRLLKEIVEANQRDSCTFGC